MLLYSGGTTNHAMSGGSSYDAWREPTQAGSGGAGSLGGAGGSHISLKAGQVIYNVDCFTELTLTFKCLVCDIRRSRPIIF